MWVWIWTWKERGGTLVSLKEKMGGDRLRMEGGVKVGLREDGKGKEGVWWIGERFLTDRGWADELGREERKEGE